MVPLLFRREGSERWKSACGQERDNMGKERAYGNDGKLTAEGLRRGIIGTPRGLETAFAFLRGPKAISPWVEPVRLAQCAAEATPLEPHGLGRQRRMKRKAGSPSHQLQGHSTSVSPSFLHSFFTTASQRI
ncbi:hypothetical protein O1611_g7139 [Lasiodiplodia mahajangana]|uniref:Uncharacterized protein n=1 Tax=Lasiodiplodia mahajangana TaxID=1108764 RepID=A0ACC2JG92_9PEZI|nr:hypothetical protein O1611_g7139 [Lasiodiplodia mahajangana]